MSPRRTVWTLERHTLAKHAILRAYLNAWLPIMGIHYNTGLSRSSHRLKNCIKAELVYLFIDEDAARRASSNVRSTAWEHSFP